MRDCIRLVGQFRKPRCVCGRNRRLKSGSLGLRPRNGLRRPHLSALLPHRLPRPSRCEEEQKGKGLRLKRPSSLGLCSKPL